jgi:CRISPR/Cas system-associated exonuclease Cas4 (RecB family)
LSEQQVEEMFYKALYKEVMQDRSGEIHVSDILYDCLRRGYYSKIFKPRTKLETVMTFWIGQKLHETPMTDHHELSLEWNGIYGTIDEFHDGIIIDKKTTRSLPSRSPYPNHKKQLEYYQVLAINNGYSVRWGCMLYIDVAEKKIKVMSVRLRKPEVVEAEMLDKYYILKECLDNGVPPARSIGWACNYCDYNSECFGDDD